MFNLFKKKEGIKKELNPNPVPSTPRGFSKVGNDFLDNLEKHKSQFDPPKTGTLTVNIDRVESFNTLKDKYEKKIPAITELLELFPYNFVISDLYCKFYFKVCLDFQKCGESLSYLDSVKEFKKKKDVLGRRKAALSIIQNFLLIGSKKELNISKEEKVKMAIKFESLSQEECPIDFFDSVDYQIHFQLKTEGYPKFLESKEFCEYYQKYGCKLVK